MQERSEAEDVRRYQLLAFGYEMRRLAAEAGMDVEAWLDSPACQAYMEGLSPLGLEAVEYQRELADRRRENEKWAWHPEEGSAGKTPYPSSLQPARDAEAEAQTFLETFRSQLTAPAALAMATALAKRGKLDDTNMRRAEELYEQRVKSTSADYWPTGESVVTLLFGRLPG